MLDLESDNLNSNCTHTVRHFMVWGGDLNSLTASVFLTVKWG